MVAQGTDGVVLKVTCKRPTLTEPNKVYALKGLINYHNAKTMSRVSCLKSPEQVHELHTYKQHTVWCGGVQSESELSTSAEPPYEGHFGTPL